MLAKRAASRLPASRPTPGSVSRNACQRARSAGLRSARTPATTSTTSAKSHAQPGRTEERRGRDQRAREPRQRLPALLVDGDDLRHDVDEQHGDDAEGDGGDQRRIDERRRELLPQRLPRLEVVGKPRQHVAEASAVGTRADEAAVERREAARKVRERRGQRLARRDVPAERFDDLRDPRSVGLLGHGGKRLVDGHARLRQRGPLPREHRGVARRPATCAVVEAGGGLVDGGGREPVRAKPVACTARGIRVEHATRQLARRVDRLVPERGHRSGGQASRVTRTSSASEVEPSAIQRAPSLRSVAVPAACIAARTPSSPARSWIARRTASSTTMSS